MDFLRFFRTHNEYDKINAETIYKTQEMNIKPIKTKSNPVGQTILIK